LGNEHATRRQTDATGVSNHAPDDAKGVMSRRFDASSALIVAPERWHVGTPSASTALATDRVPVSPRPVPSTSATGDVLTACVHVNGSRSQSSFFSFRSVVQPSLAFPK